MATRTALGTIILDPAGGAVTVAVSDLADATVPLYEDPTVVDRQESISIDATGGTFAATFDGQTTSAVAYNATAATLEAAFVALSNVATGDITVTKSGSVFTLTYGGQYQGDSLPTITLDDALLTGGAGTATLAEVTAGSVKVSQPITLTERTTYYCAAGVVKVSCLVYSIEIATETNAVAKVDVNPIATVSPCWPALVPFIGDAIANAV